jgi:electron-transferring-flavoprotein dehydrogenase
MLTGGSCIQYGARVINEGGLQSVPKLSFPGGLLIGCSAGFLNVPKIKGTHTAMKSGMLAADSIIARWAERKGGQEEGKEEGGLQSGEELLEYQQAMERSWVWSELRSVRNVHPSFSKLGGLYPFMAYSALEDFILRGRAPWTFRNHQQDHQRTRLAADCAAISYPPADGTLSFDLLTNLTRSGVQHEEDQPRHLRIKPHMAAVPVDVSLRLYAGPEQRFCPAKVYEYVELDGEGQAAAEASAAAAVPRHRLQINASNCIHCKSCAIKTPELYIDWTVPEGGGGPN